MRVLIYGGRDFYKQDPAFDFLDYHVPVEVSVVISGTARGADQLGEAWAESLKIPVERYPADWETHGKKAGFIRNQQMLDSGIDFAIQFPGGNGTRDMRRRLDKAGVTVCEFS